jgi:hypothetical protein
MLQQVSAAAGDALPQAVLPAGGHGSAAPSATEGHGFSLQGSRSIMQSSTSKKVDSGLWLRK